MLMSIYVLKVSRRHLPYTCKPVLVTVTLVCLGTHTGYKSIMLADVVSIATTLRGYIRVYSVMNELIIYCCLPVNVGSNKVQVRNDFFSVKLSRLTTRMQVLGLDSSHDINKS